MLEIATRTGVRRFWHRHATAVAAIGITAALSLRPIWHGSWPSNHDENGFLLRILIFASHIRQGDWLPVWSSADALGYGSPEPAIYHKLFYLLAGSLLALFGNVNASAVLTVGFFLVIGGIGQYLLILQLTAVRSAATAGAVMLVLANYTVTNWMVRGALAELSAAMLIPGLLALTLTVMTRFRFALPAGLLMGLLILAHSVVAAYVVAMATVAAFLAVVAKPGVSRDWWPLAKCGLVAAGAAALVAGPYVLAMAVLSQPYDLTPMTKGIYSPSYNFAPLIAYLRGTGFEFGRHWHQVPLELDRAPLLWLGIAATAALAALGSARVRAFIGESSVSSQACDRERMKTGIRFLISLLCLCVLLQLPLSSAFYRVVPGAAYLQFPWRLLALTTPILITLSIAALCAVVRARLPLQAALLTGVWLAVSTCGAFQPIQYAQSEVTSSALNAALPVDLSMMNEYYPIGQRWRAIRPSEILGMEEASGCTVTRRAEEPEALIHHYGISCSSAATIALPEVWSRAHAVMQDLANGSTGAALASRPNDQGLLEIRVPAGSLQVEVRVPTMVSILRLLP